MAADREPPHTSSPANNIGTLRLVGALAVLFGHSFTLSAGGGRDPLSDGIAEVTPYHLGLPGLGVAMFFAISGYLVTRSFQRRGSLLRYLEARALRIYPALWCAIALTLVLGVAVTTLSPGGFLGSGQTLGYAAHNAALLDARYVLPGVFADNPLAGAVNGSLWTLPVELRMYAFVAIAGVVGLIGRRLLFNLAAVALVVAYLLGPQSFPLLANPEHVRAAVFFLVGAALYVNRDWIPLRGWGVALGAGAAALLSGTDAYPLAFAIAFSYGVLWLGWSRRLRMPDLAARGDLSYATYLYAFPVAQLWISLVGGARPWAVLGLTTATVLPLAWLSWHLVEDPALRQKGRLVAAAERLLAARPRAARALSRS